MDQNGQPIGHAYAYYSSGEEDYVAATGVAYGGQVQHQYVMQNPNMDMNQMRPQMQQQQLQMQHPTYTLQPHHPSLQHHQMTQVQYDPNANVGPIYHQPIASTPPPPSPYDPVSPASLSDHSASGTESAGAISARVGGVPLMPATRVYHAHSHSHSSQSSTSSLHGGEHPYANPHYTAISRGHSRTRSIDSRSMGTTPPPGHPHAAPISDDDNERPDLLETYVDKISLHNRKESTRRQRIQAEQRRRDELRDGYSRLKEVLPISTSKSSKVSLIERARGHILDMDAENAALREEVEKLKKEVQRLEKMSEQLALSVAVKPKAPGVAATAADAIEISDSPSVISIRGESEPAEHISIASTASPMEEVESTPEPADDSERELTPAPA